MMETLQPIVKLDIDLDEDCEDCKVPIPKVEPKIEEKPQINEDIKPGTSVDFCSGSENDSILPTLQTLRGLSFETEIKQEVLSDDDLPLSELSKFESEVYVGYSPESSDSEDNFFECNVEIVENPDTDKPLASIKKHKKSKKKSSKKEKKSREGKIKAKEKKKRAGRKIREKKEPKPKKEKEEPKEKSECKLCSMVFSGLKEFRRHTRVHFSTLTCPICLDIFQEIPALRDHVDAHITNYNCQKCGQAFIRRSNMKRHEEICDPEAPRLCPHCGKHFELRRQLRQHIVLHDSDRPYKCKYCPKTFRINSRLADHEKTHIGIKPHKCSQCGKPFHSASDLKKHEKRHENPNFRPNYVDKDRNKIARCNICNEDVINIRKHMLTHYKSYGYSCGVCHKALKSYKALLSHVKIHEGNPWECDICLRRFNRKNNMLMHRERHNIEGYRAKIKQKDIANQMMNQQIASQFGGSLTTHLANHLTNLAAQLASQTSASHGTSVITAPVVSHQIAKLI